MILFIWILIIIGILIMKKIEPHNWWYPPYAILIGVLVTISTYLS